MKTFRLTERVVVIREYIIQAEHEDEALDKMNSGGYVPTETEEEDMDGITVEVLKRQGRS